MTDAVRWCAPRAGSAGRACRAAALLAAVVVAVTSGCSGRSTSTAPAPAHTAAHGSSTGAMGAMPVAAPAMPALDVRAPDAAVTLRSGLELLLGDHVLLTIELMRDRLRAGPAGRAQAAIDAVQANTEALSGAVQQLYGADASARFGELWSAHVTELAHYASALAGHDTAGERTAEADLRRTESDLGRFLSGATGGALPESAAQAAVRDHVHMLLAQADRYARGDYPGSYRLEREGFEHMVMVADTLAGAIATSKHLPAKELGTPRRQLQSALSRLFAEHMGIVVEAMRAAYDRSADFSSVGTALNADTTELGDAVKALYGGPAASTFLELWAQHVDALVAYSDATARKDAAAKATASRSLDDFATRLAEFLATATKQRLPAVQLTGALTEHDRDLTSQLDAYAAGRFQQSQQIAGSGYSHMFTLAATLATAIGDAVAARLPHGGPQTGGGGMARHRR